jgi:hypothetical protein
VADVTKRILRIHVGLLVAELVCLSAFVIELERALHGNELSWAYVVVWPSFAGYAVYMWQKLVKQERFGDSVVTPCAPEDDDAALIRFNEYLREVHEEKPPNQPNEP